MKYCLKYTNQCKHLDAVDEIQIVYLENKDLLAFLQKYSTKRIILLTNSELPQGEINKLKAIRKKYPELAFAVAFTTRKVCNYQDLIEADIDFFITKPCDSWEELHALVKIGVSDINCSGPLGFLLPQVKYVLNKLPNKINIRITPNKTQSIEESTPDLIKFYLRPESLNLYSEFIDILEFEDFTKQDMFYEIYSTRYFTGHLNQCVYNLNENIDNKGLTEIWDESRIYCGQKCLQGHPCRRCYDLRDMSLPLGEEVLKYAAAEQQADAIRKRFMSGELK